MESEKAISEQKEHARKSQFAPAGSLPKDPKAGYQTYPSMLDIKRMTLEELENVKGFRIWTEFGQIEFLEKVDLTGIDLREIITIDERGAEVYVDGVHDKPEVGKGLNVKSLITLNNIRPRKNQTASAKEEKLKRCLESKEGAQHISYNGDTGVWEFRVDHYTRWGDDSEEDEDEQMDKESHEIEEAKNIDAPIVTSMINDQVLKDIAVPFESITNRNDESLSQGN